MTKKPKPKLRWLRVSSLLLNADVNRELRPSRVKQLREKWNQDAVGTFSVWIDPVTGKAYVIDGQHRKVTMEELGLGETTVPCLVFEGRTFDEACELFLTINEGMRVRPFDRFDKGVKAGRPDYVGTKRIAEAHGFTIAGHARDGKLSCVEAALATYRHDDGRALGEALETIVQAFGHKAEGVESHMVKGLGLVFARYDGQVDRPALAKKLAKFPGGAPGILGVAKQRRSIDGRGVAQCVANIAIDSYNRGRRSGGLDPV